MTPDVSCRRGWLQSWASNGQDCWAKSIRWCDGKGLQSKQRGAWVGVTFSICCGPEGSYKALPWKNLWESLPGTQHAGVPGLSAYILLHAAWRINMISQRSMCSCRAMILLVSRRCGVVAPTVLQWRDTGFQRKTGQEEKKWELPSMWESRGSAWSSACR